MKEMKENYEICHCMKVTYADVENAMHTNKTFKEVEDAFKDVQGDYKMFYRMRRMS